jgi:L-asparaginase II
VVRSGLEESVHAGDVAVVGVDGEVRAAAGDPDRRVFARSAMKPLQAAASLSLAPFDFTDREVAVMCGSHNAEWVHLQAVRLLLARAGVPESDLQCPPARPREEQALEEDPVRRRIYSDCSGKHGAMLAACRAQGWPAATYRHPEHPLQQAVLRTVLAVTGLPSVTVGVDGCGVPVHGLPLRSMAAIYARMADPGRWGEVAPHVTRVTRAMGAHPYLVGGRDRVDTAVMQAVPGVVVKGGAEGLLCAAVLGVGLGVAVKVRDGSPRAAGPALIRALRALGALDEEDVDRLGAFARPPVLGGGRPVGEVVVELDLRPG